MRRKHKVWYEITMDGPCIHNSKYWYGGGTWFIPQYDENGKGLNNPAHSNWQRCNTKRAAIKASYRARDITGQAIRIEQIFFKKNIRYKRSYYLRAKN